MLLGNGDGTFRTAVNTHWMGRPTSLVVDDFNRDGRADVAVATVQTPFNGPPVSPAVWLLLSNGDGTFRSAANYDTGTGWADGIEAADFNGDGKSDLGYAFGWGFDVRLGNGDGTFQTENKFEMSARLLAVGDFNNDGKADMAVLGDDFEVGNRGVLTLLLGRGDGTLISITNAAVVVGPYPVAVRVGVFNGDGSPDLFLGSYGGLTELLTLLLGKGEGTFRSVALDIRASEAGLGDADNKPDLVIPDGTNLSVRLNAGNSSSVKPTFAVVGDFGIFRYGGSAAAVDSNSDGKPDLVMGDLVMLGKGDGLFQPAVKFPGGILPPPVKTAAGDFNGDGPPT